MRLSAVWVPHFLAATICRMEGENRPEQRLAELRCARTRDHAPF